jgi:hypothetical protein
VQTRDTAASDLHQIVFADPLNTDAITAAQTQVKTAQASLTQAVAEARQQHTNRLLATVESCRKGNDGKGMWKALKTLAAPTPQNELPHKGEYLHQASTEHTPP